MAKTLIRDIFDSEIGKVISIFDQGKLCALDFIEYEERCQRLLTKRFGEIELQDSNDPFCFRSKLDQYLKGDCHIFDDMEVSINGTEFQKNVWRALRQIPSGQTMTYAELAHYINKPKAVRAVGYANSLNPIALVIPCHRVIGKNGSLTGYAGGLDRKAWLLQHEAQQAAIG